MGHKTLVGGTAYEVSGGKTLVGGTGYKIDKGKTLVGGTAYTISFVPPIATLTLKLGDGSGQRSATMFANDTYYRGSYQGETLEIAGGTTVRLWLYLNDLALASSTMLSNSYVSITSRNGGTSTFGVGTGLQEGWLYDSDTYYTYNYYYDYTITGNAEIVFSNFQGNAVGDVFYYGNIKVTET